MTITIRRAHELALFDRAIRAIVASEPVPSWPIPVRDEEHALRFRVFYYSLFGPPPATQFQIYPPNYVVDILPDGSHEAPVRVTPGGIGLPNAVRGQPFATHAWPSEWTWETSDAKRFELYESYDAVFRLWAAGARADSSEAYAPLARFRRQFLELTEPPLLSCYRTLGAEFFAWAGI